MKPPFPGMDPYIEAFGLWEDFHNDLILEIEHALARMDPERYFVRAGERSYHAMAEAEEKVRPLHSTGRKDHNSGWLQETKAEEWRSSGDGDGGGERAAYVACHRF